MQPLSAMVRALVRDYAVVGVIGAALAWPLWDVHAALGFLAGCAWLALNTASLGWLIANMTGPGRRSALFLWLALCVKIPVAYLLLLWLFSGANLQPQAVVAALATLPLVMLFEGLARRTTGASAKSREEGS